MAFFPSVAGSVAWVLASILIWRLDGEALGLALVALACVSLIAYGVSGGGRP